MKASDVITRSAKAALKAYETADEPTRQRLAQYRRLDAQGFVRHWRTNNDPIIPKLSPQSRKAWRDGFGERSQAASQVVYRLCARATLRDPKAPQFDDERWTPLAKAADLEAQAVVVALILRDRLGDDSAFGLLVRAWRSAGLPL